MTWRYLSALTCVLFLAVSLFGQNEDGYSSGERIGRIRELAKKDSQVIPSLTHFLTDPSRDIRVEAVKAIVNVGSQASLDPLVIATHDNDPEVQIRATDGIVNFYLPGYVARGAVNGRLTRGMRQVKGHFSSRNDQVIGPDVAVRPTIGQALGVEIHSGASMEARQNAARAAGILRAEPAVPSLEDALRSKDSDLMFESLVALQKIKDPSAGPAVSFLARDLDDRIQVTALETVGILHSLTSAPDVRSALSGARNTKVRRAALECLAMLALPGDRNLFQQHVEDSDAELRAAALEGLGRIREPEDFPALQTAFDEQGADWKVHLAAAFASVNEGKVEMSELSPLQYLIENLDAKKSSNVAVAYLTELCRREDVRKAIMPVVKDCTKDQKLALCGVLASSGGEDVLPLLNVLAKDIDPDVSLAAVKGLRIAQARRT